MTHLQAIVTLLFSRMHAGFKRMLSLLTMKLCHALTKVQDVA